MTAPEVPGCVACGHAAVPGSWCLETRDGDHRSARPREVRITKTGSLPSCIRWWVTSADGDPLPADSPTSSQRRREAVAKAEARGWKVVR